MHRAMAHWLDWNQRAADKASFTWRLEDLEFAQPELLNHLGWKVSPEEWTLAHERARKAQTLGALAQNSLFIPAGFPSPSTAASFTTTANPRSRGQSSHALTPV